MFVGMAMLRRTASPDRSDVGRYVLLEIAATNGQLQAPLSGCCELDLRDSEVTWGQPDTLELERPQVAVDERQGDLHLLDGVVRLTIQGRGGEVDLRELAHSHGERSQAHSIRSDGGLAREHLRHRSARAGGPRRSQ